MIYKIRSVCIYIFYVIYWSLQLQGFCLVLFHIHFVNCFPNFIESCVCILLHFVELPWIILLNSYLGILPIFPWNLLLGSYCIPWYASYYFFKKILLGPYVDICTSSRLVVFVNFVWWLPYKRCFRLECRFGKLYLVPVGHCSIIHTQCLQLEAGLWL